MIVTTSAPATFHLEIPETTTSFSRADLEFLGLEHSGPSVEVRVFFNAPQANEDTPTNDTAGFVGFFSIFGHGGCFGDEGHCEMPERRPTDYRPVYALTPITKHIDVTDAVRRILAEPTREVDVTIVPLLHDVPPYVPEDLLSEPVKFQRLSIVFYS
jgi:hypothetical protein